MVASLRMLRRSRGLCWLGRWLGGIVVIFRGLPMRQCEGLFDSLFGSSFGVGLGVAHVKRSLVFDDGFVALLLDVKNTAEINVSPGQHTWITREADGLTK